MPTKKIIPFTPRSSLLHFSLQGSLPEGEIIAINLQLFTVSWFTCEGPRLLHQVQLTEGEMRVFLPLLHHYPAYCPHEYMLASFQYGNTKDETVEVCRTYLNEAINDGVIDATLRPLRNILSRARIKISEFGLFRILSILETGYQLVLIPRRSIDIETESCRTARTS